MVILSWHILINFCVSLPLSQDIVKDPKFILGGATRTDICQGDLGESFPLGGPIHAYTPWGAAGISLRARRCCPCWAGGSSEAEGGAHAHLAHSHLFGSTLPSMPGTILVQWDSRSGQHRHMRLLWTQGAFSPPAPPNCSTVCPGQAETRFLETHRLSFTFQEG